MEKGDGVLIASVIMVALVAGIGVMSVFNAPSTTGQLARGLYYTTLYCMPCKTGIACQGLSNDYYLSANGKSAYTISAPTLQLESYIMVPGTNKLKLFTDYACRYRDVRNI